MSRAPRVLILDDHAGFRKLLRLHITSKWPDAQIIESDPVSEDRQPASYAAADYDLVLLDYQLGGLNGFDFLRHFRTVKDFPPVIMLTGEGNERLAVEAIKLGATDYIPKQQMTHEVLTRAAQEALDARGAVDRFEMAVAKPIPERQVKIKGIRILNKLSEGGMSTVYLAEREPHHEKIVLKLTDLTKAESGEGEEAMQRFTREYEILRKLEHPRIVKIFEQGFTDDYAFIAMEYFSGGSLRDRLRAAITPDEALKLTIGITEALTVVHQAGVVHRDLKPHNVMFRNNGDLALIDFGVAKSARENSDLTRAGLVIGTPHYISPEQVDGLAPDARSDLYSLGVMFYEMLTGTVPYTARTPMAVLYKHRHAPIPELPEKLAAYTPLVQRLIAKAPKDRCQDVGELLASLNALRACS